MQIFDTAGQETYKSLTEAYYRRADCCLLVYDISNRETFDEIKNYYYVQVKQKCKKYAQIILLGNKTDLEDQREVPPEDGASFCLENDYLFMETSCLNNSNVADAFETLIEITHIELMKRLQNSSMQMIKKKIKNN